MKATIVEIKEAYTRTDVFGTPRHYAGYKVAKDENGDHHYFIDGSVNRIRKPVKVGDTGIITREAGTHYNLPFFTLDK